MRASVQDREELGREREGKGKAALTLNAWLVVVVAGEAGTGGNGARRVAAGEVEEELVRDVDDERDRFLEQGGRRRRSGADGGPQSARGGSRRRRFDGGRRRGARPQTKTRTPMAHQSVPARFLGRGRRGRRGGANGGLRFGRGGPQRRRGDGGYELGHGHVVARVRVRETGENGEEWDGEREREQVGFVVLIHRGSR